MMLSKSLYRNARDIFGDIDRILVPHTASTKNTPRYSTSSDKDAYYAEVELPGVEDEDVSLSVKDGVIEVRAERKKVVTEMNDDKEQQVETVVATYETNFLIPDDVDIDAIEASYKNGMLSITALRKAPVEKKIDIKH